jgi:thiosulfate reductase cytochrome b subunit
MSSIGAEIARRQTQPLFIRLTHWLNVPLLAIMAGSGLQILVAYPYMGPQGQAYSWYPLQGFVPPSWVRFGGWLAGARQWHFATAWFLVINGIIYLVYEIATGEWRRRTFIPQRDSVNAFRMFAYYLRIRNEPPPEDFYNGLQRASYTGAMLLGIVIVLSGLAIYKPLQLHWLLWIFGSYDVARLVHLLCLAALAAFALMHVVLVALHPRTFVGMITGGKRA